MNFNYHRLNATELIHLFLLFQKGFSDINKIKQYNFCKHNCIFREDICIFIGKQCAQLNHLHYFIVIHINNRRYKTVYKISV